MHGSFPVHFAAIAFLLTAETVYAVPAKPVDASSVTLLPVDGTPDRLRKPVVAFDKKIAEINVDANGKREKLRRQMLEGFDKAAAKAQSAGNLEAVLALKAAKENFDALSDSDVPFVKNAISFREKRTAEIESTRLSDALKAAKDLNDELEAAKKEATKSGDFEEAVSIAAHQKKLLEWGETVRRTSIGSAPSPLPRQPPLPEVPGGTENRLMTVNATKEIGSDLIRAKTGDTITVQFAGGAWDWYNSPQLESPDARGIQWQNACVICGADQPNRILAVIPPNTENKPFSFSVPRAGSYFFRIHEGSGRYKPTMFNDNRGSVHYHVQVTKKSNIASPSSGLSIRYFDVAVSGYATWLDSEMAMIDYFRKLKPTIVETTGDWSDGLTSGFPGEAEYWSKEAESKRRSLGVADLNFECNWFHSKYASLRTEDFAAFLTGTITVPETGMFSFAVISDDYIVLYIDGIKICNAKWGEIGVGDIYLSTGRHRIAIAFQENTIAQGFSVQWKKPGDRMFSIIPQSVLSHDP